MTKEQVKAWIGGFEAVTAEDRRELLARSPNPQRSLDLSLSLIAVARDLAVNPPDPQRDAETEAVRETWSRLRARWRVA